MLKAMMNARAGDDVFGDDEEVNLLQQKVAAMFGMEKALFFPSGTMANQVAIKVHTEPGDEVLCHKDSHVYRYEGGGIAATSGASVRLLNGNRGKFTGAEVRANINADDAHFPKTSLLCLENTMNRGGGACWTAQEMEEACAIAREHGIKLHLDGARLWNAMVATGLKPDFFGNAFQSISVCFSKGMGCPIGSVLMGTEAFIYKAHRTRKRLGGGMRQVGYAAAACSFALDNNIERLRQDHANAFKIGQAVEKIPGLAELLPVETNIVLFRLESEVLAAKIISELRSQGILATSTAAGWVRFVLHLDVSDAEADKVAEIVAGLK